jgi:DNA-binding CsgD family transcriptional regulator
MSSLLDAAYATSTEPNRWRQLIDEISYWFGGQCFLYLRPPHDAAQTRLLAANLDPDFVESHNAYYNTVNSLVLSRPESRTGALPVMTVEEAVPQEELQRGEFFADWMRPQDFQHGVRVQITPPGEQGLMLGMLRSSKVGMITDDEAALMRLLVPHLQRAVTIASRLGALEAQADTSLDALERLGLGVVIVDSQCRVAYLNATAERLAQARNAIVVSNGRLSLPGRRNDARLQQAIVEATGGGRPDTARAGTSLRLRSQETISVNITPLAQDSLAVLGSPALALILVGHPDQQAMPSEGALREAYGLTPSEARLTAALVSGDTLQIYADSSGLSMSTVKTHLRGVFAKTGEDRQSGLVRRVMCDPLLRVD